MPKIVQWRCDVCETKHDTEKESMPRHYRHLSLTISGTHAVEYAGTYLHLELDICSPGCLLEALGRAYSSAEETLISEVDGGEKEWKP